MVDRVRQVHQVEVVLDTLHVRLSQLGEIRQMIFRTVVIQLILDYRLLRAARRHQQKRCGCQHAKVFQFHMIDTNVLTTVNKYTHFFLLFIPAP